jgi:FKBP-type peptidyl-prolyl cis-trans isomerase FklB
MLMKYFVIPVIISSLIIGVCFAGEKVQLQDENDRLNYSYGFQIGETLKLQGLNVNLDAMLKGIQDALSGTEPLMTSKEIRETLVEFNKRNLAMRRVEKKQTAERYRGEGREFLAANANRPGVVTLPSGLQYKILREGSGKSPGPNDSVTVDYRGTLINGQEFDSSYRKGQSASFRVDGVIKGWTWHMAREGPWLTRHSFLMWS